jgi:hypothetical protein
MHYLLMGKMRLLFIASDLLYTVVPFQADLTVDVNISFFTQFRRRGNVYIQTDGHQISPCICNRKLDNKYTVYNVEQYLQ